MSEKELKVIDYISCCNCGLEIEGKEFREYNTKHKYDPQECSVCKGQIFEVYMKEVSK